MAQVRLASVAASAVGFVHAGSQGVCPGPWPGGEVVDRSRRLSLAMDLARSESRRDHTPGGHGRAVWLPASAAPGEDAPLIQ